MHSIGTAAVETCGKEFHKVETWKFVAYFVLLCIVVGDKGARFGRVETEIIHGLSLSNMQISNN